LESVNFSTSLQFSRWSRDHFSAPFMCLYLANAWSQTLQTSKNTPSRVSAFHRCHWFGVKLFPVIPVAVRRIVEEYALNAKKVDFGSGSAHATKFRNFFTIAPVPTSSLTVCRRDRGDPSSLYHGSARVL